MKENIVYIPKRKIQMVFDEKSTQAYEDRAKKLRPYLDVYDRLVPVEKDPNEDIYYLVGAYPRFQSLFRNDDLVPCIVEPYTSKEEQLLKIARRFENQYTSPSVKTKMIDRLKELSITNEEITKKTIFSKQCLSKYQYFDSIPLHIQRSNESLETPVSRETINMAGRLSKRYNQLHPATVDELYQLVLTKKLPQQQIQSIDKFMGKYHALFIKLDVENQKKLLKYIIHSPALLPRLWHNQLRTLLKKGKPTEYKKVFSYKVNQNNG